MTDIGVSKNGESSSEIKKRRASIITDMFVRAHISDGYKKARIRPTTVVVEFYFQDPHPDSDRIRDALKDRILKHPRFRAVFRKEGNCVFWDSIPKDMVDMSYHFEVMDGKGTFDEEHVKSITSTLNSEEEWDATKPLWKVTLINNMKNGRSVLLCKLDHAIGDGVTMTSVLLSLADKKSGGELQRLKSLESRRITGPSLRWSHKITSFLYGCYFGCLGWALVKRDPENGLKIPNDKCVTQSIGKDILYTKSFSLEEMKITKERLAGVSINDLLMAIITIGMRRYYDRTNDPVLDLLKKGKAISACFMANVRRVASKNEAVEQMGNYFITGYFILPLQFRNVIDAVWQCKSYSDSLKVSPAFALQFHLAGGICKLLPESALIFASVDNPKNFTLTMSSVKGPQDEFSIAGYAVDDFNFCTVANNGLNLGFLSYKGNAKISVCADKLIGMDSHLFVECLESAYDDICNGVDNASSEELKPPDLTPLSAKFLEIGLSCAVAGTVALLSIWLAKK
uniref:Diacylglycerol O-acyltransferase n=1 Tax=Ditylum brightwellii TaxID=49249 RepID=A0A7S4QHV3_9STRA